MVKKKATIGDLIEIPTSRGFAYAQYTHQHPQWGGLVRVFDTMFQERPKDPSVITDGAVRFSTFFPIETPRRSSSEAAISWRQVLSMKIDVVSSSRLCRYVHSSTQ